MGKGTILGDQGDGLYSLRVDYGKAQRDAKIEALTQRSEALETEATDLESQRQNAVLQAVAAVNALNPKITAYFNAMVAGEDGAEEKKTLITAQEDATWAQMVLQQVQTKVARNKVDTISVAKEIAYLQTVVVEHNINAWCADFTEEAEGEVGTIEVPGEPSATLIVPGALAPVADDGHVVARALQSPEQAFFNAAILPGWQKFKPTYRFGAIGNINYENDTADVTLATAKSSAQDLGINQETLLSGIPVEYMNCHASAFENGDSVLVKFEDQDWENPKVIGFQSNPRPCDPYEIFFLVEIAEVVETSHTGSGGKFAGYPMTPAPPGYEVSPGNRIYHGNSYGSGGGYHNVLGGVLGITPEMFVASGSWDPTAATDARTDLRIRFDVCWSRQTNNVEEFSVEEKITVLSHDEHLDMTCDIGAVVPSGGSFASTMFWGVTDIIGGVPIKQAVGPKIFQAAPRWIPTSSSATWYEVDWSPGLGEYVYEEYAAPPLPIYSGTMPDTDEYHLQGWDHYQEPGHYLIEESNDLEHASDWLLRAYNPPSLITVTYGVEGGAIHEAQYEFVRIGGAPKTTNINGFQIVPVATPHSNLGVDPIDEDYPTNGLNMCAVVYRRKAAGP